jgi:NitT/TauT family transport system substrate-binding protein
VPLVMMVNGAGKAHGISVDFQAYGTSSTISVDAVLARQAQFGSAGTATVLQAIRQGANLKIIAAIVNNVQVTVLRNDVAKKLGVASTAPIADRVRALKGLTVATGAVGSTHYQMLRSALTRYGLNPDKDLKLVGVGEASALTSGIEQGRFDAIVFASPIVERAITQGVASVWISGPRGDIPGSENIKTSVIFARADTVDKQKADVDALRAALEDALRSIQNDRAATGSKLHEKYFSSLDRAIWELAWDASAAAYPSSLAFTREAYDYWVANDPKGAESYKNVDYTQVTYAPAQAP